MIWKKMQDLILDTFSSDSQLSICLSLVKSIELCRISDRLQLIEIIRLEIRQSNLLYQTILKSDMAIYPDRSDIYINHSSK